MRMKMIAVMVAGILLKDAAGHAQTLASMSRTHAPQGVPAGWAAAAFSLPQSAINGPASREGIGGLPSPGRLLPVAVPSPVAQSVLRSAPRPGVPAGVPLPARIAERAGRLAAADEGTAPQRPPNPGHGEGAASGLERMGEAVRAMKETPAAGADEAAARMGELFDNGVPAGQAALSVPDAEAAGAQTMPRLRAPASSGEEAVSSASRGDRVPSPSASRDTGGKKRSFWGAAIPAAMILIGAAMPFVGLPLSEQLGAELLQLAVGAGSILIGPSLIGLGIVKLGAWFGHRVVLDDDMMLVPVGGGVSVPIFIPKSGKPVRHGGGGDAPSRG